MAAIRRDKLDAVFSDLVRERAGWRSEYTGSADSNLECCHIFGRRKRSVRWHPWNAVCLTHSEHRYFTENPLVFSQWLKGKFGPDRLYKLARLAHTPQKFTPRQIEGLYQHYKAELAAMKADRIKGFCGRLEFSWPDPIPEAQPRKRAKKKRVTRFKKKVDGTVVLRGAA